MRRLAVALGLALALAARGAAAQEAAAPPDVLVVVLDDVGWPEIQQAPTPALDAFSRRGTTYRRFYVTPLCTPTRYALLFGRHGFRSGIGTALQTSHPAEIPGPAPGDTSLADLLRGSGYATGAFGKWHLSNVTEGPLGEAARRHGFDVWRAGVAGNVRDYFAWERIDDGETREETLYNTTAITDATLAWWSATEGPRFAYVAYQAAHHPVQPPPRELLDKVEPAGEGGVLDEPEEDPGAPVRGPRGQRGQVRRVGERQDGSAVNGGPPLPAERRRRRLPLDYRDLLRALDHELGRLLAGIDPERTLVWIVSDNGPPPNVSLAGPDAKNTLGEAGVHVPAWCAGPGVARGRASDELVQAVDLFAAVTGAVGVPVPEGVAEDSLVPGARTEAFLHLFAPNGPPPAADEAERRRDERAAVLADPPLKLLIEDGRERVFDLGADPWERRPLAPDRVDGAALARLRKALELPETVGAFPARD